MGNERGQNTDKDIQEATYTNHKSAFMANSSLKGCMCKLFCSGADNCGQLLCNTNFNSQIPVPNSSPWNVFQSPFPVLNHQVLIWSGSVAVEKLDTLLKEVHLDTNTHTQRERERKRRERERRQTL